MTRPTSEFRFYAELNDFLRVECRRRTISVELDRGRSVKDAIESAGVPHPEVDLILVDGESVGFDHVLRGGERVAVYPEFERLDIAPLAHLRPAPLREPRFVLDSHLGKLARHLRLAGFDTLWDKDYADEEVVRVSLAEKRIILTRDIGLLKRGPVERGYFVRSTDAEIQLGEVVRSLQLERMLRPFSRCRECNVELAEAPKAAVLDRIPEQVREHYERFKQCTACGRVYWEGTHYARLKQMLARAVPCL